MNIDYSHCRNTHSLAGPRAAVATLLEHVALRSVLDVGCGTGTWIKAFCEQGVFDCVGIDGVDIPDASMLIPRNMFRLQDLTSPWCLGRTFDVALCLEVGEHLPPQCAKALIESLTLHADDIIFGAACPGQPGQHHVNCQPPMYWQALFNQFGYACYDNLRWHIWNDSRIEPWYRQNMFAARKEPASAGNEDRIRFVIHPDMLEHGIASQYLSEELKNIENGCLPVSWYLTTPPKAMLSKCLRLVTRRTPITPD